MPSSTASKWFVDDSKMNQTWWVYAEDECPCPGQCDAALSMDSDGVWHCQCGTWDVLQEAPADTPFSLRFPDLAAFNGQRLWGDVWYEREELPRLASQTAAERAAELAALEARLVAGRVDEHLRKVESLYCDRSGQLKQEKVVLRRCKWDSSPAANGFAAGCAAHHKGKCPWVHADQPQLLAQLQAAGRPQSQPQSGRDFSALAPHAPQRGQQQRRW